jgi:hypothetical protein
MPREDEADVSPQTEPTDAGEHRYGRDPDESPTEAVVTALARADHRPRPPRTDGDAVAPLYGSIDTEALDRVVETGATTVTFSHDGHRVTVTPATVTVAPGN